MTIDLNASGEHLKVQNISNILSNFKGSMVLNREMGLDNAVLDGVISRNFQIPRIKQQIEKFCDVTVSDITFQNVDEKITIEVRVIL